ncbi:MAG: nucleotide exchange factor GrpE [Lachnospiraceae bacterium]|nr:nucleotide exchange factor GrpE [Lachnospiraceae bacterium]
MKDALEQETEQVMAEDLQEEDTVSAGEAEESESVAGEGDSREGEEKKSEKKFFQKKQDKKTAALEEKIAELEDKTMRQMAEFENFRKRTEKEKSMMFETGAKSVIEKILPVIDNFERGLAAIEPDNKDSFYEGMCMIHKQMLAELEKIGVTPIEALGKEFDPNFHNAVMQVASEELESGMVAQELQKGYLYRETVVRYSMVAVVE